MLATKVFRISRLLKFIAFLAWMNPGLSQPVLESQPAVQAIGLSDGKKIMLRWGVNDYQAWVNSNTRGFSIERLLIAKDGEVIDPPTSIRLNSTPLLPRPLSEWEALSEDDDYVALAAQALYGEDFDVDFGNLNGVGQIINQVRQNEQRYQMALFAADQSVEAARLSGLFFEDQTVLPGEKYLYRITSLASPEVMPIDTGFVFIDLEMTLPRLAPLAVSAQFDDRVALVRWRNDFLNQYYSGLILERSEDGVKFEKIHDNALPILDEPGQWLDSLEENNKIYYYRIRGLSPFGIEGIASDTVSGQGVSPFQVYPENLQGEVIDNEEVQLLWGVNGEEDFEHFAVLRSAGSSRPPDTLIRVPPDVMTYTDTMPLSTNYYWIAAEAQGKVNVNFPILIQLEDTIPPSAPRGLNGSIDSTGLVIIEWIPNDEPDLLGYRLMSSGSAIAEMVPVNVELITTNRYIDTISVKTLDEHVYYTLLALDRRYNPSDLADTLILQLPDINPPVSPVFKGVESSASGTLLVWVNSASDDVENQLLYRRKTNERKWQLLEVINNNSDTSFFDNDLLVGEKAAYTLVAVDEARNESKPSIPILGSKLDIGERPAIENIYIDHDPTTNQVQLTWRYGVSGVWKYYLYKKSIDNDNYSLIGSTQNDYYEDDIDDLVQDVAYKLQAVFQNGATSILSRPIKLGE